MQEVSMVSFGRSKAISTIVCASVLMGYLYFEFSSKKFVEIDTTHVVEGGSHVNDQVRQALQHEQNNTDSPTPVHLQENGTVDILSNQLEVKVQTLATKSSNLETSKVPSVGPPKEKVNRYDIGLHEVKTRPFNPKEPKMILLLAQQRVGSTFIGGIFDKNTNAMYVYEPLEGVYTHMYGTAKGWNVPLDIHFHWNKTYRHLPPYEMHAVAKHIEQTFTCDFDNMLTESLVHEFWSSFRQTQLLPYSNCLKKIKVSVNACQTKLKGTCNGRVGQNLAKEKHCFEQLKAVFSGQPAEEPFKKYKTCMDQQRTKVMTQCVPIIQKVCDSKPLHVIKTVRMDLETVVSLMERYPNMRVIHLMRDPRSVVLSRIKSGWALHGTTNAARARSALKSNKHPQLSPMHVNGSIDYSEFSLAEEMSLSPVPPDGIANEAQMYCSLTRKDIITRRHLEEKFPGSTYQMIYDHMVSHPYHELERIYQFIDEPIPKNIGDWVKGINSGKKTSQSIAEKWRTEMTVESAKEIDTFCQTLYDTIEYSWPDP